MVAKVFLLSGGSAFADIYKSGGDIEWYEFEVDIGEVLLDLFCEDGHILELDEFFGLGGELEYQMALLLAHDSKRDRGDDAL